MAFFTEPLRIWHLLYGAGISIVAVIGLSFWADYFSKSSVPPYYKMEEMYATIKEHRNLMVKQAEQVKLADVRAAMSTKEKGAFHLGSTKKSVAQARATVRKNRGTK